MQNKSILYKTDNRKCYNVYGVLSKTYLCKIVHFNLGFGNKRIILYKN